MLFLMDDFSRDSNGIIIKMLKSNINALVRPLPHSFYLTISTSSIQDRFKISVIHIHKF